MKNPSFERVHVISDERSLINQENPKKHPNRLKFQVVFRFYHPREGKGRLLTVTPKKFLAVRAWKLMMCIDAVHLLYHNFQRLLPQHDHTLYI